MKLQAAAKINWYLKVLGKRADGYHELEMLMQRIALYDELTMEVAEDLSLSVVPGGLQASMPLQEDNLILKAAKALQQASGTRQGAAISLLKRIPIRAGLGGGSADAAAVLHGLNRLWRLDLSLQQLMAIGLKLGADVPYCLMDGPAIVGGMGEKVEPVYLGPPLWLVLLVPEQGLSTAEVFKQYDMQRDASHSWKMDSARDAILRGHFSHLERGSGNSLRQPADRLLNSLTHHEALLRESGAQFVLMTGAGSALYGAYSSRDKAVKGMAYLQQHQQGGVEYILTHTLP